MDFMFDWEAEGDRFSFEDSDRFEDDSLCSWISEPESLCNNWRGWKKQQNGGLPGQVQGQPREGAVTSLVEFSAKAVACHIPFEVVEGFYPPIPEQLQLLIAFNSFPENEEDIRLYSCLANGSADEFQKGDHLLKARAVKDALQIGFHLSATVIPPQNGSFNVAVVFDRKRVTNCNCTCGSTASWCSHIVAVCLFRIHQATSVLLRAPVSESLSRLHRDQLQKFAQYLISELPQQILPTAQKLLDELLSSQQNAINTLCGAPDPTAGPSASEQTTWCLDDTALRQNIRKTLSKFSMATTMVFSDVNYLSSTAPPAAAEWQSLLRPLRGREPEGMWNLLSIVREIYRRGDSNATPLLEIVTEELLSCENILVWWFNTKISASHNSATGHSTRGNNASNSSQHAGSSLCDEVVALWKIAAMNPSLSPIQRDDLRTKLKDWHIKTIDKVRKARGTNPNASGAAAASANSGAVKKSDIEIFSGFKLAIEHCQLDWSDYVIPGITYVEKDIHHRWNHLASPSHGTSSSSKLGNTEFNKGLHKGAHSQGKSYTADFYADTVHGDGGGSSSSEGFCEPGFAEPGTLNSRDSDSSLADENEVFVNKHMQKLKISEKHRTSSGEESSLPKGKGIKYSATKQVSEDMDSDSSIPSLSAQNRTEQKEAGAAAAVAQAGNDQSLSESQQSSDEYQLYFYDPKSKLSDFDRKKDKKSDEPNYFAGIRKLDNKQDNLFSRAEALHAHGYTKEACKLAKQLAEEMLNNPPDVNAEPANQAGKGKKKKHQNNNTSSFTSTTLAKAAFLCSVLLEDSDCHHLAFKVGMFGLEMPRQAAASKALEVKLANQESELVTLLKKIPLGKDELDVIRDRAEQLRDGKLRSRGEALLPLMLASFIFDSLCLPAIPVNGNTPRPFTTPLASSTARLPSDEVLGFEAAVAALGLKANISEAEHPLLCEGTRRQRGDLAIAMLVHYKDDQVRLAKVMDKILDREVHQMYKAPPLTKFLSKSPQAAVQKPSVHGSVVPSSSTGAAAPLPPKHPANNADCDYDSDDESSRRGDDPSSGAVANGTTHHMGTSTGGTVTVTSAGASWKNARAAHSLEYLNLEQNMHHSSHGGARPKIARKYHGGGKDSESSALEEEGERSADYKAWEAKFRSTILKPNKKHSAGMASIDSSAPETTSSDNSPTLIRRNWAKHTGPGSDSGSSGKSSDSIGSSSSGDKGSRAKIRDNESPPLSLCRLAPGMIVDSRSASPNVKGIRYKGKNRVVPTVPNQPSEALAHFMFELAKTVLMKAGGSSSTSLFTQPNNQAHVTGPHRALHLCAFQIGLYALGLHNCVSPNWLSRTYSSHVSWITGQAMEIGSAAINILIETWDGHLTPPECVSLADRASRGRDPNMVRAAAELALSCLPHAQSLNPTEIQRALIQCKEQTRDKLEKALLAVESAAKDGGVYPEVLFDVARRWYELYEESMQGQAQECIAQDMSHDLPQQPPQALVPVTQQDLVVVEQRTSPPMALQVVPLSQPCTVSQAPVTMPVHMPYPLPPGGATHHQVPHPHHLYVPYVQQVHHPNFGAHYSQAHMPIQTPNVHPAYITTYHYQNQQFAGIPHIANLPNSTPIYHANSTFRHPPPMQHYGANAGGVGVNRAANLVPGHSQLPGMPALDHQMLATTPVVTQAQTPTTQQPTAPTSTHNTTQMNYLMVAYRVNMLAMETLGRRVHDDRPQTKYARNPPYGEDVKWALSIAMKLGAHHVQQFCATAVNAVVSPFILQDIAVEAAHFLAKNNPAQVSAHLRSPILSSLVQKCLQMFIQCTHQRMHHINPAEYDEFVGIICIARNAFCMTPGGMVQFNELLQSLRRAKSCKKELWQRIVNGLATGNIS